MSTTTAVIASQILSLNSQPITVENIKSLIFSFGGICQDQEINEVVEKIGGNNLEEIQQKGQAMMGSISSQASNSASGATQEVKEAVKEESEEVEVDMDDFF